MIWGMCMQAFFYCVQWEHWCFYVCLILIQEMKELATLIYLAFGDSAVPLKLWSPKFCFTIRLLAIGEPCKKKKKSKITFWLQLHLNDYQAQLACWIFIEEVGPSLRSVEHPNPSRRHRVITPGHRSESWLILHTWI